ncbi:biotin/lipoyl-binding protein, partial [Nocardioides sp. R-C-SC26]|uniref:biotin/lipoyl-binding protein n=1 Tax=Nocardioides sp. R-C-SC26 TaxID=2870414 RepID=UPI001E51E4CA
GAGARPPAVTTATVSRETVQETVAISGTIAPARSADLDFAVSGTVTRVLVEAGDEVRRGQALARIDATSLRAARSAALSTWEAAQAQLAEDGGAGGAGGGGPPRPG